MGVKWGILSTAAINELVLAGARASDRVDVVAVASREFRRARRYALANDIERALATYQALLSDPEVEAVYIPLPNSRHVEWTRRALEAGKHVLVEKPFGRHAAEVAEVCELADRKGLVLAEAFMWRHHPQTARALALVAEGAIGRLLVVRAAFSIPLEQLRGADDTRFDPALDGGSLMDVGCYCVSAIRLVSGAEPVRASAEQVLSARGVDVVFAATMRMGNGVLGQFECGFLTPHRYALEIVGDEASLFLGDPWHCREPAIEVRYGNRVECIAVEQADSYRLQMEAVSDAIRGRSTLAAGTDDARAQARAIEMLYRSAESGRTIEL